jgi:hypothetical protein
MYLFTIIISEFFLFVLSFSSFLKRRLNDSAHRPVTLVLTIEFNYFQFADKFQEVN